MGGYRRDSSPQPAKESHLFGHSVYVLSWKSLILTLLLVRQENSAFYSI
jgi:hypothetical protein